jgi:hypothetical protein
MSASAAIMKMEVEIQYGTPSSRHDHAKGARPRKRGDDAPGRGWDGVQAGGLACSVGQHTVSSMSPFLAAPRACLAWRPRHFATNRHE